MASYTKVKLSQSVNGLSVLVAAVAITGTLIHASDASALDETWLWATNTNTGTVKLTVEWGGETVPNDIIEQFIPPESGLILVIPGLLITGSKNIRAIAGVANVINLHGYVNRIT